MPQGQHISAEDTILVENWRTGRTEAGERLISKYQARIYNVILRMCANPADAAELTQDTFVKIIEHIDNFESRSGFYTWAFRIAVNLTLNFCRRRSAVGFSSLDAVAAGADEQARASLATLLQDEKSLEPAKVAENKELCELVQKAIGQLNEEYRTMIVLRDIEGMDYAQIADVVGVELGTVKSRLSRARSALRQILEAL